MFVATGLCRGQMAPASISGSTTARAPSSPPIRRHAYSRAHTESPPRSLTLAPLGLAFASSRICTRAELIWAEPKTASESGSPVRRPATPSGGARASRSKRTHPTWAPRHAALSAWLPPAWAGTPLARSAPSAHWSPLRAACNSPSSWPAPAARRIAVQSTLLRAHASAVRGGRARSVAHTSARPRSSSRAQRARPYAQATIRRVSPPGASAHSFASAPACRSMRTTTARSSSGILLSSAGSRAPVAVPPGTIAPLTHALVGAARASRSVRQHITCPTEHATSHAPESTPRSRAPAPAASSSLTSSRATLGSRGFSFEP